MNPEKIVRDALMHHDEDTLEALEKLIGEKHRWRLLAIDNGKRLENIRQLTTHKHETLAQFVSRVRDALYRAT